MLHFFSHLPADLPPPQDERLLSVTSRFFLWEEGGKTLAYGGEILPDAIGDRVYLWLQLEEKNLPRSLALRGMRLVREYLSSLLWTPYAECAFDLPANERFLLSCGFAPVVNLEDRVLYRWRK